MRYVLSKFAKLRRWGLVACFLVPVALHSAESSRRQLNSEWQFRALNAADHPEVSDWHVAQVPGAVQTDLLADRLIPDPFSGDNESRLQWIGLTDWEYRSMFQVDAATLQHEHVDLIFDGLDTFAEVFLNEQAVLNADNMFRRWRITAKPLLKAGANTLRIVLRSPITSMIPEVKALPYILPSVSTANAGNEENVATAPYTRKAPYQYGWDWGPRYVTIGIWKPIWLETWDQTRMESFHIHQLKVTSGAAELAAELEIECTRPVAAAIAIAHADASGGSPTRDATQNVQLDGGINHVSIPLRVASPKLWYPAGYGAQDRYRFSASVKVGKDLVAQAELKTGLRAVELRREPDQWGKSFTFVVNGIPVFAKGANVIPFDSFPSRVTTRRYREVLEAARAANMNMVREWGGGIYESDDFYDICDELGLMVWQEFMFGGDMVPGDIAFQESVRDEATYQVKRLRDHPSIVLWCGNNEVETGWLSWSDRLTFKESITPQQRERVWQDYVVLFHDIIKSVVEEYGSPTAYWPSSPSANFEAPPGDPGNGDMHYWGVWHSLEPVESYTLQNPRFMSEFGFQSFPDMQTILSFAQPGDLTIDSEVMKSHQKNHGGNERILTYMLREYPEPKDFASFVYVSQVQQAEAIKAGAEALRRNRPRTMGALFWQLNDCWPTASWSSIDYYGRWKALQYYARRFYADLLISPLEHDGIVDVYVVSDKLQSTTGQVRTRLLDFDGTALLDKTQEVEIPAQSSSSFVSINKEKTSGLASLDHAFLVADLKVAGQIVSRNELFFDKMRNLQLPLKPAIQSTVAAQGSGYTVTLSSPVLARNVYLSFGQLQAMPADNFFDLIPGEEMVIQVTSPATIEQLQRAMKIISLTDAFFDERPTYRGKQGVSSTPTVPH